MGSKVFAGVGQKLISFLVINQLWIYHTVMAS